MHTDFLDKSNFKKTDTLAFGWRTPGLKTAKISLFEVHNAMKYAMKYTYKNIFYNGQPVK